MDFYNYLFNQSGGGYTADDFTEEDCQEWLKNNPQPS